MALICSMDVVGLYRNILHGEGLEAIREGLKATREALDKRDEPEIATNSLIDLASLVLESNYFEFNVRIFRKKLGTAIETNIALYFSLKIYISYSVGY